MGDIDARRHGRHVTSPTNPDAANEDNEVLDTGNLPSEGTVMKNSDRLQNQLPASPLGSLQVDTPPPTYYRYELKNVLVTSYDVGGASQ